MRANGPRLIMAAGEEELWSGRPMRRGPLGTQDYLGLAALGFMLIFAGLWQFTVLRDGVIVAAVMGAAIQGVGIWVICGVLARRWSTDHHYMVTNRRLIISQGRRTDSFFLSTLPPPVLGHERPDGSATVAFGAQQGMAALMRSMMVLNGATPAPVLTQIPDAERVCRLIMDHQKA